MIDRFRPLSSTEREHVRRAIELSRPTSRIVMLVVTLICVPYLAVLIAAKPVMRLGLTGHWPTVAAATAGLILGLLLLRRGMQVRAQEMEAHGKKLSQLAIAVVRELVLDVDEYWIVHDVFEEVPHAYLLRSGARYVLLLPNRASFVPHRQVEIDVIEPLGHILRNETSGPAVAGRGTLPHVEELFRRADCSVLTAEELPEAWRGRVAA